MNDIFDELEVICGKGNVFAYADDLLCIA